MPRVFLARRSPGSGETSAGALQLFPGRRATVRARYPAEYQDCHWAIVTSSGHNVRLSVSELDAEPCPNATRGRECHCNYLQVNAGSYLGLSRRSPGT